MFTYAKLKNATIVYRQRKQDDYPSADAVNRRVERRTAWFDKLPHPLRRGTDTK
jgi:hypothetical protein